MKVKVCLAREFSIHRAHWQRVSNAAAGINSFLFAVTPAAHQRRHPLIHTSTRSFLNVPSELLHRGVGAVRQAGQLNRWNKLHFACEHQTLPSPSCT